MPYDLIALGETMLSLAPPPGGSLRDAATLQVDHAGAESNTCVGLARLGLKVAWVSRLGVDEAGDRIVRALEAEGVDTRWVERDLARPTGVMLKEPGSGVRYYRTGSAASEITPKDVASLPLADARAVLVTGVTALIGLSPRAAGLALLNASRGLRIVDPNLRKGLWGSDRRVDLINPFIERCDLLIAGSTELAELLGQDHDRAETLARHAAMRGPYEVVVRAEASVGARDADGVWHEMEITRHAAVDAIGAGDAFNAGYIALRLQGGSIQDALDTAVRCGAAVTASTSDTSGFPHLLGNG